VLIPYIVGVENKQPSSQASYKGECCSREVKASLGKVHNAGESAALSKPDAFERRFAAVNDVSLVNCRRSLSTTCHHEKQSITGHNLLECGSQCRRRLFELLQSHPESGLKGRRRLWTSTGNTQMVLNEVPAKIATGSPLILTHVIPPRTTFSSHSSMP